MCAKISYQVIQHSMKPSDKIRNRCLITQKLQDNFDSATDLFLPRFEGELKNTIESITEFQQGFEYQIKLMEQEEVYSRMKIGKQEKTNQELNFWNHLIENIMDRQKKENKEIARIIDTVANASHTIVEIDKEILLEMEKRKNSQKQEEDLSNVKLVKFKNITNNSNKNNPLLDYSNKTLKMTIQKGKEVHEFELKYIPQKQKYIPLQQYHPKATHLISQFNFHKSLPRLQEELAEFINTL